MHCGSCGGQFGLCCAGGDLGVGMVKVGFGFGVDGAGGSAVGDGLGCCRVGCGLWLVGLGWLVGAWVVEGCGSRVMTGGGSELVAGWVVVSTVGTSTGSVLVVVIRAGGTVDGVWLGAVRSSADRGVLTLDAVAVVVDEVKGAGESAGTTWNAAGLVSSAAPPIPSRTSAAPVAVRPRRTREVAALCAATPDVSTSKSRGGHQDWLPPELGAGEPAWGRLGDA